MNGLLHPVTPNKGQSSSISTKKTYDEMVDPKITKCQSCRIAPLQHVLRPTTRTYRRISAYASRQYNWNHVIQDRGHLRWRWNSSRHIYIEIYITVKSKNIARKFKYAVICDLGTWEIISGCTLSTNAQTLSYSGTYFLKIPKGTSALE